MTFEFFRKNVLKNLKHGLAVTVFKDGEEFIVFWDDDKKVHGELDRFFIKTIEFTPAYSGALINESIAVYLDTWEP